MFRRFAVLALLSAPPASAQVPGPVKGDSVVVTIPRQAFGATNPAVSHYLPDCRDCLTADVTGPAGSPVVNGDSRWIFRGLPAPRLMSVAAVKAVPSLGVTLVKMEAQGLPSVILSLPLATTAASWEAVTATRSRWDSVVVASRARVKATVFVGSLAQVDPAAQDSLVMRSWSDANAFPQVDSLQGRAYLRFNAPVSTVLYNRSQTSDAQRQAGVLNEVAFPLIRSLGKLGASLPPSAGFVVVVGVRSDYFASYNARASVDSMLVYVPADVAASFSRAEITSQDAIDRSIVVFDGNRIKIDLTK